MPRSNRYFVIKSDDGQPFEYILYQMARNKIKTEGKLIDFSTPMSRQTLLYFNVRFK